MGYRVTGAVGASLEPPGPLGQGREAFSRQTAQGVRGIGHKILRQDVASGVVWSGANLIILHEKEILPESVREVIRRSSRHQRLFMRMRGWE